MNHRLTSLALLLIGTSLFAAERPNIVLIFSDDQGWGDVSCYKGEIPTPNIDSLARDGARFKNWYVASSICNPSKFRVRTCRHPILSKLLLLGPLMSLEKRDASRGIHQGETTIASVLQRQGYVTALVGKWHLGHGDRKFLPTRHGFDSFYGHTAGCIDFFTMRYGVKPDWYRNEKLIDETGYATDLITDDAIRFLDGQKGKKKPFFLFVPYNAPHFGKGYDPGKKSVTNILQAKKADLLRVKHIKDPVRRVFAAMVLSLDDGIGRILKAIKKNGQEKNTLVIFMTDHGGDPDYGGSNGPLRGEKATLFEGGIRVPCLMRWPGRIKPGVVVDSVCSSLDLFPTFCDLSGADAKKHALDGQRLTLEHLNGKARPSRELFWELHTEAALRVGSWKYLRDAKGKEYLFDLMKDRDEKTNLAEKHADRLQKMRARHRALSAECRKASPSSRR